MNYLKRICAIVCFVVAFVLIVSCSKNSIQSNETEEFSTNKDYDTENNNFSTTTEATTDELLTLFGYESAEEIQAKYPDKTVLAWVGYASMGDVSVPVDMINEYLSSLGKDYVICFKPIDVYSAVISGDSVQALIDNELFNGTQADILTRMTLNGDTGCDDGLISAYYTNIYNGYYEPLDDYFENSEEALAYYNSLPEEYWDSFRVNGVLYSFGGSEVGVRTDGYYYINTELAEKYGWDYDKTISEQLDIVAEVMEAEECAGISTGWSAAYYADYFDDIIGVVFDNESGILKSLSESEKLYSYLETLYEYKSLGLLENYDSVGLDDCFIYIPSGLKIEIRTHIQKIVDLSDNTADYTVVPMSDYTYTRSLGGIGIYSGSEYKSEAFDFILLSQTDAYLNNLLTYGIEGEDYNITNGVSDTHSSLSIFRFENPLIGFAYGDMPENMNELYAEILEMATPADESEAVGFAFDVRGYEELYAAVQRAASNHSYVGYSSVEADLAALKSELEEAGIDELLEEINRQYSEWRANNYD